MAPGSSGGTASPPTKAARSPGSVPRPEATSSTSCRISAGTACSSVASAASSASAATSTTRSRATMRTVAPQASGSSVSKSQMSKAKLASDGMVSPGPKPNASRAAPNVLASAPCVTATPLGVPVEPEV
jgi:hypothetical protein